MGSSLTGSNDHKAAMDRRESKAKTRHPTAPKKNADRRDARSTIGSISAASQWHRQWVLWDRIERRPTARTLSMFKTNTNEFIKKTLGERSGSVVECFTRDWGVRVRASSASLR